MLVHSAPTDHTGQAELDVPYEGAQQGMAADTLMLTPLVVQQEVPNAGVAQTGTNKEVNPTYEQGEGRAPGWKWGWMRKNIPLNRTQVSHAQRHYGYGLQPELERGSGHKPGTGPGQAPGLYPGFRPFMSLAEPTNAYYTAQNPPLAPWAEPV